jgi:hypothetical protein
LQRLESQLGGHFLQTQPHSSYLAAVSSLAEIEAAIAKMPHPQFRELLHRLNERDAEQWDLQIEADARSGKLDGLYSRLMGEDGREPKIALDEVLDDPELS